MTDVLGSLAGIGSQRDRLRSMARAVADEALRIRRHSGLVSSSMSADCAGRVASIGLRIDELAGELARQIDAYVFADREAASGGVSALRTGPRASRESELSSELSRLRGLAAAAISAEVRRLRLAEAEVPGYLVGLLEPDRQIIMYDPIGEGRVVEVFGDLSSASRVAVVVGGMGSSAANFDANTSMRAHNLHEVPTGSGDGTATVAWNGYDAPDQVSLTSFDWFEVVSEKHAREGAEQLGEFLDLLDVTGEMQMTLIGHSYGSLVVAEAARGRGDIDEIIVMGSPGVGDLGRVDVGPGVGLWTMGASRDPIDDLGWFGDDPNDPASGWTRLDTGDDVGHGSYLMAGTASLMQAGLVVAGRGDEAVVREPSLFDRVVPDFDDVGDAATSVVVEGVVAGVNLVGVFDDLSFPDPENAIDLWQNPFLIPIVAPLDSLFDMPIGFMK
ncbi:MAG: hypothetical protein GY708_17125 [Actinomycetia bacterium]|nr:hypothetical protein [Actinomycetes bacterium]